LVRKTASIERPWDAYIFDFIAKNASDTMFIEALENAITQMEEDFGSWNTPWGDINRFQRITPAIQGKFNDDQPSIPIPFTSSFYGSLAAYGSRQYPNTKQWYGSVGNSFVAAVEFGDKVLAKSLLAGGQSGDPSSPHFIDQAEMYSRGEFKDVHFYREDVLKNKKISYRPGQKN
ncbi:MAG TPA: penicillin acylase family protein, partial [Anditalea sp.]|nr:penicillin acylase family protein [Anditalea sp.]